MNVYCLYFPNGKRYVGVESREGERIQTHSRMGSLKGKRKPQLVHVAIAKHGWEQVQWRYLAKNCSNTDGWALERFFIRQFRTQEKEWGYNRSSGGEKGGMGVTQSPEIRAKHRDQARHLRSPDAVRRQRDSRMAGAGYRPFPQEYAFRGVNAGCFKRGHSTWNKGRPMSEETREKVSKAKRGKTSPKMAEAKRGTVGLPAGPNGEMRFFRPEQLI